MNDSVQWLSRDPRNGAVIAYTATDNDSIERSFQQNRQGTHQLSLGGNPFTIHFSSMTQTNTSGGSRQVLRRTAHPAAPKGSVDAQISQILSALSPSVVKSAFEAIEGSETMSQYIGENLKLFHHKFLPPNEDGVKVSDVAASCNIKSGPIVAIISMMLQLMFVGDLSQSDADFAKGQAAEEFDDLRGIDVGMPVPSYFANVKSEGIFRRKYLSLLGLRNLAIYGPQIFGEIFETLFSSNPGDYKDDGIARMRLLTGNVVDLDTVILNCGSQLRSMNEMRAKEKLKPFKSAEDFFASPETITMVQNQAEPLIKMFVDLLGLSPSIASKRHLALTPGSSSIPTATHNGQRGMWPVWGYQNVGVHSYHANIPHVPDVMGALLRAPFQIVKAFLMCLTNSKVMPNPSTGTISLDVSTMTSLIPLLREFFDEAVNDSCFNAKWKAIEAFTDKMTAVDSIDIVISNLQSANQHIFNKKLFDSDDDYKSKELNALCELVVGKGVQGRDPDTKTIRLLCKQDLENWIKKT